jgi:DNA-binding MarR family transcriptional regulator
MDGSPEASALTEDVGFLLSRASGVLARASNAVLTSHGLRVRSYAVLVLVCEAAEGVTQRELADVLGLDPSQVVLLVDDLAASGLVERRPSTADRRNKLVVPTGRGRDLRRAAAADVEVVSARQLADLSRGELQLLRELLTRLVTGSRDAPRG